MLSLENLEAKCSAQLMHMYHVQRGYLVFTHRKNDQNSNQDMQSHPQRHIAGQ
jgi:hypothetical protein